MKLYHRIRYFIDLWGVPDPWVDGETIDAAFAWALAGAFAEHYEEWSKWEPL